MIARRLGWVLSLLSVIALVFTVAVPLPAMAAPMAATTHLCANCPDSAPMPGKATGAPMKAMPCGMSMCLGAVAALPAPEALSQPVWRRIAYMFGPFGGLPEQPLAPDPFPPRRTVLA